MLVDIYDGTWYNKGWSLSGQEQCSSREEYTEGTVDLTGCSGQIQLRFRAVAAGGPQSDMAIDDIEVTGVTIYGDMNTDNIVNESDLPDFSATGYRTAMILIWMARVSLAYMNLPGLLNTGLMIHFNSYNIRE